MRIALDPPSLGHVRATIVSNGTSLSVRLEADTSIGAQALHASLPDLRAHFAADATRVTVSTSGPGSPARAGTPGSQSSGNDQQGGATSQAWSGGAGGSAPGSGGSGFGWGGGATRAQTMAGAHERGAGAERDAAGTQAPVQSGRRDVARLVDARV